ncbi:LOW QUALITY PROTEIN: probable low affinity copper uptake protein 2 [Gigantopelta aegis]|uniref:LOW QUALITY PROTEIN: probable low affinity copper uptake protein 2 n=1 Tax=Gigantopelta aegis TaxID=1735272 RepID=UPI001B88B7AE|nr:LOW QUALITY PROTEIN: probable low affinity copper uptake protein 2 [Gigantopelta aegis]
MFFKKAYFHLKQDDIILFKDWQLSPGKVTFLSCLALVIVAVLYQALKTVRHRLGRRCCNIQCKRYILNRNHLIQTVLYLCQFIAGYFIMLAVMTYNVWVLIATLAGLSLGYFCFGWRDYEYAVTFPTYPRTQRTFAADCSNKNGEQELLALGSENCEDTSESVQTTSIACSCDHVVG